MSEKKLAEVVSVLKSSFFLQARELVLGLCAS